MDVQKNLPEAIEVKHGGYVQYFIYMALFIAFGAVNSVLKIQPPYLYYLLMVVGVVAVMSMNTLTAMVFTKVIIRATKEGIWTSKLNLVPWNQIKDIRLEKTSAFSVSPGHMTNRTMIELIIETTDERESVFWGRFLNTDVNLLCTSLNNFWQANK